MILYRVMISGKGIQFPKQDYGFVDIGFVKNEYVIANSSNKASTIALSNVEKNISELREDEKLVVKKLELEIDEVERHFRFWKLIFKEGFIFFKKK